MTLNPLHFSEEVNKQYLRYQLTSARLTDSELGEQFEDKLWRTGSPLFKGPFVSLSRAYKEGSEVSTLVGQNLFHQRMQHIVPYDRLYQHQEDALRAIKDEQDVLVTTGTGSGKTEAFLYPIIDRCLHLQEQSDAPEGVTAVVVYPMNALAADQLERLRELLVGTGVTFGRFVGPTPEDESRLSFEGRTLSEDTTRDEYQELREDVEDEENVVHLPHEERYTREQIREDPPDILLVNKAILEFQLTRNQDLDIFLNAPVEYIVMDEAHTNSGAQGAEVSLLLRRLKELADPPNESITHIATSATIVDEEYDNAGQRFMKRLFGVDEANVQIIREAYEGIDWPEERETPSLPPDPEQVFQRALAAISISDETERVAELESVFRELTGDSLPEGDDIEARLFKGLLHNEFAYQLHHYGASVRELDELVDNAWSGADRGANLEPEDARHETLTYLVLGAAAEQEETPLFRPKLHYFVKGLEGAVAVLDKGDDTRPAKPTLFLNADEAKEKYEDRREEGAFFPVLVCPQCGQHHYEQYLQDVTSAPKEELQGGMQTSDGTVFYPDEGRTESRILFTDTIVHREEDAWENTGTNKHTNGRVCYACGALHTGEPDSCGRCERNGTLLPILILDSVDEVSSCPVCSYNQGDTYYDDPFRALKEVTVENVYVLAQDMLNQADEEGRRLIVFTDNRQEAAFQAGWMQDRARRYRFRRLLFEHLPGNNGESDDVEPVSLETVIDDLAETLDDDRERAELIAPEVFEETVDSEFDTKFRDALRRYLTIHVLREVTESYNTRASLEAWGKLSVHYAGVSPGNEHIRQLAESYGFDPEPIVAWLQNLLDWIRKKKMLHHQREPIFSHTWDERLDLVRNQYLPALDFYPNGMRLDRPSTQDPNDYVYTWISQGRTRPKDWAHRLNLSDDEIESFLEDVWELLVDELELLTRLNGLEWASGDRIEGTQNVYHLNAHKIGVTTQNERYQCEFCGQIHPRPTPNDACIRYRCEEGEVHIMADEEPRDYDLVSLENAETFVMAEEHTAQVPTDQRSEIERKFKEGEGVNCLVATPTLELGVDIGALDMVLLRNVPPRSENYWQRAGRAGRRNRMALIYTYVRSNPHDLHFFEDPTDLLGGAVRPPKFNLKNPVMIQKHVHAAVLTQLHAEYLDSADSWLHDVIPGRIGDVVFDDNQPRESLDPVIEPLENALKDPRRKDRVLDTLERTFASNWPEDAEDVSRERLEEYVAEMPAELKRTYQRVLDRLEWAWRQRARLARKEAEGEMLSEEEKRFKNRCETTIETLQTQTGDSSSEDRAYRTYTLSVLSREGFLPGYANSRDSVVASAERAYSRGWDSFEFDIHRPTSIAIHEHLPGNRIYANGGKYQVNYYQFPATDEIQNPREWYVNPDRYAVKNKLDAEAGYHDPQSKEVSSLPLSDSQLRFISHVEDMETTRFRMPSISAGTLRRRHSGGMRYEFGEQTVDHLENQLITLLNFGPEQEDDEFGFPICTVCGGVRSPYEDDAAIERFEEYHEEHCGEEPDHYALHVHSEVDGLLFQDLGSEVEAVSLGEALTLIGSHLFDMERDDLHWLPIPDEGENWQLFFYDPMPGGSGLLEQFIEEWSEVYSSATDMLAHCPSACSQSCYDCLRTYHNQFFHEQLDRHQALDVIQRTGETYSDSNVIEPINEVPDVGKEDDPTNIWEKRLEQMITEEWGYSGFEPQQKIELPDISRWTKPDLVHEDAQIAIYLDGPDHDDSEQRQQDLILRNALKTKDGGWAVIEIPIQDAENEQLLEQYRQMIGQQL